MIFDAHCHAWEHWPYQPQVPDAHSRARAERLLWEMDQAGVEKAILCGSLLLVLSAELLNSAVEAVVDKVSPEFHELAGRAKDFGSAAVFMLMMNVLLCWGLLLWQRI